MAIDWIGFGYAIVVALGGVVGYTRKGSIVSLVAGLFFGLMSGYGAYCVTHDSRDGCWLWGGAGDEELWGQEGAPGWDQGVWRTGGGSGLGKGIGVQALGSAYLKQLPETAACPPPHGSYLEAQPGRSAPLPCLQALPLQLPLTVVPGQWELRGQCLG
uniref:Transmembrane protein 14C n=1 Tax=Gopherus evgoodei TaxID=1825980 RepID=A0A8C4VIL8_9SAUR